MKYLNLWTVVVTLTISGTFARLVPELNDDAASGFDENNTNEYEDFDTSLATLNATNEPVDYALNNIGSLKEKLLALEMIVQQFSTVLSDVEELKTSQSSLDGKVGAIGLNVETIVQTNAEQEDQIKAIQIKENTVVAFTAFIRDTTEFKDGEVVVFDMVVTNYGAAYSDICGTFKAPVHGLYVFTVNFITDGAVRPTTNLNIMVNNQKRCVAYADNAHRHTTGVCTVVVELRVGELVNVVHDDRHGDGGVVFNGYHTGFTGYLQSSL